MMAQPIPRRYCRSSATRTWLRPMTLLLSFPGLTNSTARIVELRFFGDLTIEEAADVLGILRSTVQREWNAAQAWLTRQMKRGSRASGGVAED
jgi:DNA-directed RNA polymerase specialized sigma24 family protein